MASTVTDYSSLIDNDFPVAGTTNNVVGFHDNFSNIKNALDRVNTELEAIRNNGVYLNDTNIFQGGTITNVVIENSTIILNDITP